MKIPPARLAVIVANATERLRGARGKRRVRLLATFARQVEAEHENSRRAKPGKGGRK